jgi:hypothetical protein
MRAIFALGALIGAYAGWSLTSLYFWTRQDRGRGDGGTKVPDGDGVIPDDLSGESWAHLDVSR